MITDIHFQNHSVGRQCRLRGLLAFQGLEKYFVSPILHRSNLLGGGNLFVAMASLVTIDSVLRRDNGWDSTTNRAPSPVPFADEALNQENPDSPIGGPRFEPEEDFYGEDDASVIQPAMSPVVTRLTSPKTPAAEKEAAMDRNVAGYFDLVDESKEESSSGETTPEQHEYSHKTQDAAEPLVSKPAQRPDPEMRLPSPWRAGPKEMVVTTSNEPRHKHALASALTTVSHRRSSSSGAEALRRLSKALPSISLPSHFMPNRLVSPSFFSTSSATSKPESTDHTPIPSPQVQSSSPDSTRHAATFPATSAHRARPSEQNLVRRPNAVHAPASAVSRKSLAVRRSTSDESLLYSSLSRMSSFGDDHRFTHVREQVNSRFKAIVDSFEPPSFKLPSIPSNLSLRSPMKKTDFTTDEISRGPRDPLDIALEALTGDLVIMGGYRGSVLRSAEPPHRQLWVPIKVGLNVRKVNLEVGLDPEDEERMEESIIPSGMLKNIGPVDISRRLFKRLRECENVRNGKLRVHDYGYDWRLSPHLLSKKLVDFMRKLPSNQGDKPSGAFVIAHSLGGVITRHAVNQAPNLFSGVVYAGSPQRCINILGPLRNGDAVLLNEKVLTPHVNFSLRTTFVFLPEDGFCFIDKVTNEEYPVDFYNPDDWVKYRLCPSVGGPALPPFVKRPGPLGSLLSIPDSLTIGSRGRSGSDAPAPPQRKLMKDRSLAPQMDASSSATTGSNGEQEHRPHAHQNTSSTAQRNSSPPKRAVVDPAEPYPRAPVTEAQQRNLAYLTRTLADTKRFRAESQHDPQHQAAGIYPPIAVIYGKGTPTCLGARVAAREAIPCADVYDNLAFGSGDGVVLARWAMPPPGYEIVRGGRVSTDKGHISILGDFHAVGRAITSVLRGRQKGIGLGRADEKESSGK